MLSPLLQEEIAVLKKDKKVIAARAAAALNKVEGQVHVLTRALIAARRSGADIPELSMHRDPTPDSRAGSVGGGASPNTPSSAPRVPLWDGHRHEDPAASPSAGSVDSHGFAGASLPYHTQSNPLFHMMSRR